MLNQKDILQTQDMIDKRHLDIRTITMGISLLDCADNDVNVCARKIYDKITRKAENLVKVGQDIEWEFGIPIVNKRISVTPISLVGAACRDESYVPWPSPWIRRPKRSVSILLEAFLHWCRRVVPILTGS